VCTIKFQTLKHVFELINVKNIEDCYLEDKK